MTPRLSAAAVHLLTATGAAFALLAPIAAARSDWRTMFLWLGVALIVDAVDRPLARRVGAPQILPRWSGERLDLVVDFLTYIAVPAVALSQAELLPEHFRLPAGIAIVVTSLFHMADMKSKTEENYFVGFPAIWNVVAFFLFAFVPPPFVALAIVLVFVVLTFVPVLCVHPIRVAGLRQLTMIVTLVWGAAAIAALAYPFPSPLWVKALLLITAAYLAGIGAIRSFPQRRGV
jgi:phosphatidylcholine synthase